MKVIFLDYDGVLNNPWYVTSDYKQNTLDGQK